MTDGTQTSEDGPPAHDRRRRVRLDTERRRAQLLRIGAQLFAEQPYEEVGIDRVAELAGVSRTLLYHYFPAKRDFFLAVVRNEGDLLLEITAPDPTLPTVDRLTAALDGYLRYAAEHSRGYRAFHRAAAASDQEIRTIHREHLAAHEQRVVRTLTEGPGTVTTLGADTLRLAVRGWLAMVVALSLEWLEHGGASRAEVRDLAVLALLGAVTTVPVAGCPERPEVGDDRAATAGPSRTEDAS